MLKRGKMNKIYERTGCNTQEELIEYIDRLKNNPKIFGKKLTTIKELTKNMENVKFLDIGCWLGIFLYHLKKEPQFKCVEGIDIDEDYVKAGREFVYDKIECKSLFDMEKQYDVILMSEVIEHVDNPKKYVQKIYDLVSPGGYFIIITPSAISLTNILLNIKHWKNLRYIEKEKRGMGTQTDHYYCWDKLTLFRLCNSVGFKYNSHNFSNGFRPTKGQSIIMVVKKEDKSKEVFLS